MKKRGGRKKKEGAACPHRKKKAHANENRTKSTKAKPNAAKFL